MPPVNTSMSSPPNSTAEAKQRDRFSRSEILRFTVEQVKHTKKHFLVFTSMGMLLGSRFIDPVSLTIVMSMQFGLIIPG